MIDNTEYLNDFYELNKLINNWYIKTDEQKKKIKYKRRFK